MISLQNLLPWHDSALPTGINKLGVNQAGSDCNANSLQQAFSGDCQVLHSSVDVGRSRYHRTSIASGGGQIGLSRCTAIRRASFSASLPLRASGYCSFTGGRLGPLRRNLNLSCCDSVNNGNGKFSAFEAPTDMDNADMGGSNPNVIGDLQEAKENPFPKCNFNEKSQDPLEQLKNQVRSFLHTLGSSQPQFTMF